MEKTIEIQLQEHGERIAQQLSELCDRADHPECCDWCWAIKIARSTK